MHLHHKSIYSTATLLVLLCCALGSASAEDAPLLTQSVIYRNNTEGYFTFRVPSLVTSPITGTMFAFADGMEITMSDDSPTDTVLRRSLDGGLTWQPMQVVVPGNGSYMGEASPVVIRAPGALNGAIIVPLVQNDSSVFVTKSFDDGLTWSAPQNITSQVKGSDWGLMATGPAHAIQLSTGRILVTGDHRLDYDTNSKSYSSSFYSDDFGETWHQGGTVPTPYTNESSAVELADGSVYMNMRDKAGPPFTRWSSISTNGGETWSPASHVRRMVEPKQYGGSQASLVRYTTADGPDETSRILFANPFSTNDRSNISVRVSYDEAQSWSLAKPVYLGPSAYSDMAIGPDGNANLLYERGSYGTEVPGIQYAYQEIALARFNTQWLEGNTHVNMMLDFNEQTSGAAPDTKNYIRDSSGYDMHAKAENAPTYVPGDPRRGGSALRFTSASDRVSIDSLDDPIMDFHWTDSFTVEFSFKTTEHDSGGPNNYGTIISRGGATDTEHPNWFIRLEDGQLHWHLYDTLRNIDAFGGQDLADGEWHQVCAVRNVLDTSLGYASYTLYIDHEEVSDVTGILGDLTSPGFMTYVGDEFYDNRSFIGDLDYMRVSVDALEQSEFVTVPEPGSITLAAAAGAVLLLTQWRRRRRAA